MRETVTYGNCTLAELRLALAGFRTATPALLPLCCHAEDTGRPVSVNLPCRGTVIHCRKHRIFSASGHCRKPGKCPDFAAE